MRAQLGGSVAIEIVFESLGVVNLVGRESQRWRSPSERGLLQDLTVHLDVEVFRGPGDEARPMQ